jgi:hypothetical protein
MKETEIRDHKSGNLSDHTQHSPHTLLYLNTESIAFQAHFKRTSSRRDFLPIIFLNFFFPLVFISAVSVDVCVWVHVLVLVLVFM